MEKILLPLLAIIAFTSKSFAADGASKGGGPYASILMLVLFFAIFWFLLIRPQHKKNKEIRKMFAELTKGDEVVTKGGVIGKIIKIDESIVNLEITENTIIKIQRNAVANILPKGSIRA